MLADAVLIPPHCQARHTQLSDSTVVLATFTPSQPVTSVAAEIFRLDRNGYPLTVAYAA